MGDKTEYIKLTLKEIKEGQQELTKAFHAHAEDSGIRDAKLGERVRDAHLRVDRHEDGHKETRGWFAALWTGVIVSLLATAWNYLSGRKHE
jgi:hypothetical protein